MCCCKEPNTNGTPGAYEGNGRLQRRVDTFKTLRGFRNGMSPRRFYRLANGFR